MPSIALNFERTSTHLSPSGPSYSQSISDLRTQSNDATTVVGSQPSTQLPRLAGYNQVIPTGGFLTTPLEQYRLQLYNYAVHMERFHCPHSTTGEQKLLPSAAAAVAAFSYTNIAATTAAATAGGDNGDSLCYQSGSSLALSMSLFPPRIYQSEEPKPQHSYIGLIAMAILNSAEMKLVLSDIYQHILENYPYFRTRGPGWRNSIRHNLSLNDCFVKSGRSANGKGHFWSIHPANMDDFRKGDFRRRKAQRKVRKHMGLSVDDEDSDTPSPPLLPITSPQASYLAHQNHHIFSTYNQLGHLPQRQQHRHHVSPFHQHHHGYKQTCVSEAVVAGPEKSKHYISSADVSLKTPINTLKNKLSIIKGTTTATASVIANLYSRNRKRQFDVASLLAPDVEVSVIDGNHTIERATGGIGAKNKNKTTKKRTLITNLTTQQHHLSLPKYQYVSPYISEQNIHSKPSMQRRFMENLSELDEQEDIDVVASDVENDVKCDEIEDEIDEVIEEFNEREGEQYNINKQHILNQNQNFPYVLHLAESNNRKIKSKNVMHDSTTKIEDTPQQQPNKVKITTTAKYTNMAYDYHSQSLNYVCNANQQPTGTLERLQEEQSLQRFSSLLPNELNHVDPRILGSYYGTYMAATAAQHIAARRITNSMKFPIASAKSTTTINGPQKCSTITVHQEWQKSSHIQKSSQPEQHSQK